MGLHRQAPVARNAGFNTQAGRLFLLTDRLQRDNPRLLIVQRRQQRIQRFNITLTSDRMFHFIGALQSLAQHLHATAHIHLG
ncbi:hypothetical protein D3C81_1756910 [compost metagenome]